MRRFLLLAAFAALEVSNAGCIANMWGSDPNTRMNQLLVESENERQIRQEWQRIWFTDQPSHLTPDRVHGGIQ